MDRLSRLIGTLFIGTLFFSCTRDIVQPEQAPGLTTGRTVRREVTVQVAPMLSAQGKGTTRAVTNAALSEDEAKIHSLTVLQFGGTAGTSTLIKKTGINGGDINPVTGVFDFDFEELADGGQIKVYLLANFPASALNDYRVGSTTLAAFEAGNLSVTALTEEAMKADGLPLMGAQNFAYATENPAPFVLKSPLAKVVFQYAVMPGFSFGKANLFIRNVASAVPLKEPTAGAAVQHPAGIDYTGLFTVVDDLTYNGDKVVCYLTENLSGRVAAITQDKERGGSAVPQSATYISVGGLLSAPTYGFYLGDGTASDFNLQRHYEYTFDLKLRGMNAADKRVTVGGPANCFIVTNPGTYIFDATVRGNGYESTTDPNVSGINYATLPDLGTATEARVIWQTGTSATDLVVAPASVKLNSGKVSFTMGAATEGNAVIGIFASNAENAPCLWSWHIWRLNGSAPGTMVGRKTSGTTGSTVNVIMMDRNLGAYNKTKGNVGSAGCFYQWGRKDPFPGIVGWGENNVEPDIYGNWNNNGTTGTWSGTYSIKTISVSATVGTEAWGVKYPTAFITNVDSPFDWMSTKNDCLWGTPWVDGGIGGYNKNQGIKSIYDPCPIGYRVPPHDTWSKQTSNGQWGSNGIIFHYFNASLWYPAAGYRSQNTGLFGGAPRNGYYATASASRDGLSAGSMYFYYGGSNTLPNTSSARALAQSVRCVAE